MKLISFEDKPQGVIARLAFLSLWRTMVDYGAGPVLRSFGCLLMLPLPWFGTYQDFHTAGYIRGWRIPVVGARGGFVRGEKSRPNFGATIFMRPIGRQVLLSTREQVEDGEVVI